MMNRELKTVIDWVWENKTTILAEAAPVPTDNYSYATDPFTNGSVLLINEYMGGMEFSPADEQSDNNDDNTARVERYLNNLWSIAKIVGCTELEFTHIAGRRDRHRVKKVRGDTMGVLKNAKYRGAYFGYRKSAGAATAQIFVNLDERMRIPAVSELLDDLWDVPGLLCVKVCGPWSDRVDTVVVEYSGARAQSALLDVIAEFAQRNPHYLRPRTRKLTKPVPRLPGVSIGMGPPDVSVKRSRDGYRYGARAQSFGIYRAQLIFMALERTVRPTKHTQENRYRNGKTKRRFKARVSTYFQKAGLDPGKPWTQNNTIANASQMQRMTDQVKYSRAQEKYVPNHLQQRQHNAQLAQQKKLERLPAHKRYQPVWPHGKSAPAQKPASQSAAVLDRMHSGGLI